MLNYLQELDITYFESNSNFEFKIKQDRDLLILLERFEEPQLQLLLDKILASIKLVNCNISYQLEFISDIAQLGCTDSKFNFKKAVVFLSADNINITNLLATSYNINTSNILLTSSLKDLNSSLDTKKKLWHDLKNFLA